MVADVLLGYLHPDHVSYSFLDSKEKLVNWDAAHGRRLHSWAHVQTSSGQIPEGRNQCAERTLKTEGVEWLFMVDADMGFFPDTLDRLLEVADATLRPIVGGLCFANRQVASDGMGGFVTRAYPTILDWKKCDDGISRFVGRMHYPVNSLVRCGATGGACLLVHRSVLEQLLEKYGAHWFDRSLDGTGAVMGEDVSFFARCGALNLPLFVHTGVPTSHAKNEWITEAHFWDSELPPPATERVAVIVPVLHRPKNVRPLVESLRASTGLADPWFVCEPGDSEEVGAAAAVGAGVMICEGSFARKANYAFREFPNDEQWLLFVGDDVRFHSGWLDHALDIAHRYGGKLIATNDCHNPRVTRGRHATHPLIARSYLEERGSSWDGPGTVAHEGYGHCFVDDEWTAKAVQDGVFQAALGSRVEHLHPAWGGAEEDEIYAKGYATFEQDRELFAKRAEANLS